MEGCPHGHEHRRFVNAAFRRGHHGQQTFGHGRLHHIRWRIGASSDGIRHTLQKRHGRPRLNPSRGFLHLGLVAICLGIGQSLGRLGMFHTHPPGFGPTSRSSRHVLVLHEESDAFQGQFRHLGCLQRMGKGHAVRIERKEDGRMHGFPGGRIIIDGGRYQFPAIGLERVNLHHIRRNCRIDRRCSGRAAAIGRCGHGCRRFFPKGIGIGIISICIVIIVIVIVTMPLIGTGFVLGQVRCSSLFFRIASTSFLRRRPILLSSGSSDRYGGVDISQRVALLSTVHPIRRGNLLLLLRWPFLSHELVHCVDRLG